MGHDRNLKSYAARIQSNVPKQAGGINANIVSEVVGCWYSERKVFRNNELYRPFGRREEYHSQNSYKFPVPNATESFPYTATGKSMTKDNALCMAIFVIFWATSTNEENISILTLTSVSIQRLRKKLESEYIIVSRILSILVELICKILNCILSYVLFDIPNMRSWRRFTRYLYSSNKTVYYVNMGAALFKLQCINYKIVLTYILCMNTKLVRSQNRTYSKKCL